MFHIHTLEGVKYDVTLESLKKKRLISKTKKNSPSRKSINSEDELDREIPSEKHFSYAEKAYRDAVNIKNEREPIFHAYKIMSNPVITLNPEMKVIDAWKYFKEKKIGHMPVLSENNEIAGIVSDRDLLKYLIINDKTVQNQTDEIIKNIMTLEVITSSRLTDIRRIAKVMFEHHIGTMPILDENKLLIGIITRSDILYTLMNFPPLKLWA